MGGQTVGAREEGSFLSYFYLHVVAVLADIEHDPDYKQLVGRTLLDMNHVDVRGGLGASHLSGHYSRKSEEVRVTGREMPRV